MGKSIHLLYLSNECINFNENQLKRKHGNTNPIIDLKVIFTERAADSIVSDGMTCKNLNKSLNLAPIGWLRKRRHLFLCGSCQPGYQSKTDQYFSFVDLKYFPFTQIRT